MCNQTEMEEEKQEIKVPLVGRKQRPAHYTDIQTGGFRMFVLTSCANNHLKTHFQINGVVYSYGLMNIQSQRLEIRFCVSNHTWIMHVYPLVL